MTFITYSFFNNASWPERMDMEPHDAGLGEKLMNKLSKKKFFVYKNQLASNNFSLFKGAVSHHKS